MRSPDDPVRPDVQRTARPPKADPPTRAAPPPQPAAGLALRSAVLTVIAACLAACAIPGYLGQLVAPKRVPAVYELENRPTLVLVDDPQLQMGNRAQPSVAADRIMNDLREADVVDRFIPLDRLDRLRTRLGDDYYTVPIDRVGAALDAEQVLYVKVDDIFSSGSPGLLRPVAQLNVRVVEVESGRRLFPAEQQQDASRGYPLKVQTEYRYDAEKADVPLIMRKFTDRIGRDVARLFYAHNPNVAGHSLRR